MFKRVILGGLLLTLLLGTSVEAQTTLSCGSPQYSFNATTLADTTPGTSYALYPSLSYVSWQTAFGSAPSAVSLQLQGSNDNTNWTSIDTSTATGGEIRNVNTSARFVRGYIVSSTGGDNITIILNCVRQVSGGGSGTLVGGMADPGSDGIMVRTALNTSTVRSVISPLGTVVVGNATGVAGNITLDLDSAIYGQFASGTDPAPATCIQGDIYYETDTGIATLCPVVNTPVTIANLTTGTADPPATCSPGAFYYETDVFELSFCRGNNTWEYIITQGSQTDDALVVGSGTGFSLKVVPDCDDTAGNHLNYDTTTNTFSCGTTSSGGGGSTFDLGTTIDIVEEFVAGNATDGTRATHGWYNAELGTGTSGTVADETDIENLGAVFVRSHATNDDSGGVFSLTNSGGTQEIDQLQSADWTLDFIGGYMTSLTTVAHYVGWLATLSGDPAAATAGYRIRYEYDDSDSTFMFQVCDASGAAGCGAAGDDTDSNVAASTITPSINTYYRFRIRRAISGVGGVPTVYFRVNDETEKTFCSSGCDVVLDAEPANSIGFVPGFAFITRAANNDVRANLDAFRLLVTGLTRY